MFMLYVPGAMFAICSLFFLRQIPGVHFNGGDSSWVRWG